MAKGLVFGGLNGKAGGVTFKGNDNWFGGQTAAASPTERLSVVGAGWIIAVHNKDTTARYVRLDIDGGQVVPASNDLYLNTKRTQMVLLPFTTGFKMYANNQSFDVFYVLGDDFATATPKAFSQNPSATAVTLQKTVTGKGWVTGLRSVVAFRLDIDGTKVIPSTNNSMNSDADIPVLYRFETEAKLYAEYAGYAGMSYILE